MKATAPKLLSVLTVLGYGGLAVWKPDEMLPHSSTGLVLLIIFFLSCLAWATATAWQVRSKFRAFLELPPADKDRLLELRQAAGVAVDRYTRLLWPTLPETNDCLERLQELSGNLHHYPSIYRESSALTTCLWYLASRQGTLGDFEQVSRETIKKYHDLIAACDDLLKPDPATAPSLQ